MLTAVVMGSLFAAGAVFLGGTVLYLVAALLLNLLWLGVQALLFAGKWAVVLAVGLALLLLKLSGLLLAAAAAGAVLLAIWGLGSLFLGRRRPAEREFWNSDYRLRSAGGWKVRRDAVDRLSRWVDRLETRIENLERSRI